MPNQAEEDSCDLHSYERGIEDEIDDDGNRPGHAEVNEARSVRSH
jgi:hypothetical protein